MSNNIDERKLDALSNGALTQEMKNAIKNKDASALLSSLNENERKLFNSLMSDKQAREDLLSSPKLKSMLDSLLNGR